MMLNRRFSHDRSTARSSCDLGGTPLRGDRFRRWPSFKRVVKIAAALAAAPNHSLPDQHDGWGELKAAYHFLDNPKVTPEGIQHAHRRQVRRLCALRPRVLVVEDNSGLDYTDHPSVEGLGFVGDGGGRGLLQHTSLAVTTDRELLGVLHQIWWKRIRTAAGETRHQRQVRPKESDLWSESMKAIGSLGPANADGSFEESAIYTT